MKYNITESIDLARKEVQNQYDRVNALIEVEYEQRVKDQKLDKERYNQFLTIIEGKKFFNIKQVYELGLPFDILIFLTKKNTGKTTQIYRHFKEAIKSKQKVIYMRSSLVELNESISHFKNDESCPFIIVKAGSSYYLFRKEEINEILILQNKSGVTVSYTWAIKNGIKEWGRAVSFKNCQSIGGASEWKDYSCIIFDECIPYTPQNIMNDAIMANWAAFPSSIIRNKKEFKIFMYGNLLSTNNRILDFYGISRDDDLRYINRDGCRILFINAKEHYGGIGEQIGTALHGDPEYMDQLIHNYIMATNTRIIPPTSYELLDLKTVFTKLLGKEPILFEVRVGKCLTGKNYTALKAAVHKPHFTYGDRIKIYTDEAFLSGSYDNLTWLKSINGLIKHVLLAFHWKHLLFYDELTIEYTKLLYAEYSSIIGF